MTKKNYIIAIVSYQTTRGGSKVADATETDLRNLIEEARKRSFHVERLLGVDRDEELEDDMRRTFEDMLSDSFEEGEE